MARSFVVAVTADHGSVPVQLAAEGARWPHGIVMIDDVIAAARAGAEKARPKDGGKRVLGFHPPEIFVDTDGLSPPDRRAFFDGILGAVDGVAGVARAYDLSRPGDVDPLEPLMRASYFPGRQSPLAVRQAPRVVFMDDPNKMGTDHGTPYTYDRRVPVILSGPGVRRGRYAQPIDPRDIAPTLAFLLGVPPPDMCQGKPVPAVGN